MLATSRKEPFVRRLSLVVGAVTASILLTNIITQTSSSRIHSLSNQIVSITAPSIERLASLRGITLEIELQLSTYLRQDRVPDVLMGGRLDGAIDRLSRDVQRYLALPTSLGEDRHWEDLRRAWIRFEQAVRRTRDLADAGNRKEASAAFSGGVEPRGSEVLDAAMAAIEFNAQQGRQVATRIEQTRRRTIWWLNGLTAFSVLLGAAGTLMIYRQARHRRALVDAHARFLEERAAELEQFAGRVAHDIRNPLSSAALGAQLIARRATDEHDKQLAARITRSLARAEAISSGLLEFARAGARPDPGARTSVREVLADLTAAFSQEADSARIELTLEPIPPVFVACSEGVYLSLVGNLARNAIKYMGDAPTRCIRIRVVEEDTLVRTEVRDTGPGIPSEALPSLFEPYFRAGSRRQEGLGLGLATVKKLAEGHGGRAGVDSEVARGSSFWFTLPRAGRSDPSEEAKAAPRDGDQPQVDARH